MLGAGDGKSVYWHSPTGGVQECRRERCSGLAPQKLEVAGGAEPDSVTPLTDRALLLVAALFQTLDSVPNYSCLPDTYPEQWDHRRCLMDHKVIHVFIGETYQTV